MKIPLKIPLLVLVGVFLLPMISALEIRSVEYGLISGNLIDAAQELKVEAGDKLHVVVRVLNEKETAVEDLMVTAEIDDLDIDVESDYYDVEAQEKDRLEVDLELPYDLDEDEYQVHVSVKDENQAYFVGELLLKVKQKSHDLEIVHHDIFPQEVLCGKQMRLSVDVLNLGEWDEEDVRLHVVSSDLRHDSLSLPFDVNDNGDAKSVSTIVSIPEHLQEGDYGIEVTPRYRYGYFDRESYIVKVPVKCAEQKRKVEEKKPVVTVAEKTDKKVTAKKEPSSGMAPFPKTATPSQVVVKSVQMDAKQISSLPVTGAAVKNSQVSQENPLTKDFEEISAFLSYYRVEMTAITAILGLFTLGLILLVAFQD